MPPQRMTPETVRQNLTELDYAIFGVLPDEGSTLGYHRLFKSIRQLAHELNAAQPEGVPPLTTGVLNARLRALRVGALVVEVTGLSGRTEGWQRTALAHRLWALHTGSADAATLAITPTEEPS